MVNSFNQTKKSIETKVLIEFSAVDAFNVFNNLWRLKL